MSLQNGSSGDFRYKVMIYCTRAGLAFSEKKVSAQESPGKNPAHKSDV